jgi:signal peptidase
MRRVARRVANGLLLVGGVVAVLVAVAPLLGYQRYVITGGSMEPTIHKGSIVWDEVVPTSSLKVGDVITYDPPGSLAPPGNVTHRIAWIGRDADGRLGFKTKGDANPSVDPWPFSLGDRQARVAFHVPYAGYALATLSEPRFRMLVIGVPALLVALSVLAGLWKEAGVEAERQRQEALS